MLLAVQGLLPAESFASFSDGGACTALKAFSQLLRALSSSIAPLATSE